MLIENSSCTGKLDPLIRINISMVKSPSSNFKPSVTVPLSTKSALATSKLDFPKFLTFAFKCASLLKVMLLHQ